MSTILKERLPWLETFVLDGGAHSPDGKACIMEATAYIAGEEWSDHPECVSPVIAAFCRNWNDSLPDADRDRLLRPYITKVIGTKTTKRDEEKRAWLATDWLARECAPAFLRCAGLTEHAEALEGLAAITTTKRAQSAQPTLDAARAAAWAAAGDAARDAARAAAGDAAWAAAWAAARAALEPTVKILQPSALLLLDRMIEVGRKEPVVA